MQNRLRRYDFILRIMMFAKHISEATSLGAAVIISETTSFAEGKHHSKKPNLIGRQIRLFCCERATKSSICRGKNDQKYYTVVISQPK